MSARRLLLLPAAAALFAMAACDDPTAAPAPGSVASAPASAVAADANGADCPSGPALQRLVELPKGLTFGRVECVGGWAGAGTEGAGAGDGAYLFHYQA